MDCISVVSLIFKTYYDNNNKTFQMKPLVCNLKNNSASKSGGGIILVFRILLTVENCVFRRSLVRSVLPYYT